MEPYEITNPVPTPEEMADFLGVSRERLIAIRSIMSTPTPAGARHTVRLGRAAASAKIAVKKAKARAKARKA